MRRMKALFAMIALMLIASLSSERVMAHCDTMDGPVVKAAKQSLEKGDITIVLRWIKKEYEDEVRAIFSKALTVRAKGKEAQELADTYFFETVVRLHRAGEGEPYTGLKPSGTHGEPTVEMADQALETGDIKALSRVLLAGGEEGLAQRFHRALEAKKAADMNVDAGRKFVQAYVEFVHYAERLHQATGGKVLHHEVGAEEEVQ